MNYVFVLHGVFNVEIVTWKQPRGPKTKSDNKDLKATVVAHPSKSTSELAACCGVSNKTVLIHMKQIGQVKKLERWCACASKDHSRDLENNLMRIK